MVHQRTVRPTQPGELGATGQREVGWLLMESPSVLIPIGVFIYLRGWESTAITVFFLIWQTHYVHQAWVYPFRLATDEQPDADRVGQFRRYLQLHQLRPARHLADRISRLNRAGLGRATFSRGNKPVHHRDGREHRLLHAPASAEKENPGGYTVPQGGCSAGFPARITSAKSSSGSVGRCSRGACRG